MYYLQQDKNTTNLGINLTSDVKDFYTETHKAFSSMKCEIYQIYQLEDSIFNLTLPPRFRFRLVLIKIQKGNWEYLIKWT